MKKKPRKKYIPLSILINHCKQELMNVIVISTTTEKKLILKKIETVERNQKQTNQTQ